MDRSAPGLSRFPLLNRRGFLFLCGRVVCSIHERGEGGREFAPSTRWSGLGRFNPACLLRVRNWPNIGNGRLRLSKMAKRTPRGREGGGVSISNVSNRTVVSFAISELWTGWKLVFSLGGSVARVEWMDPFGQIGKIMRERVENGGRD